jgi:hypothetical protein
MLRVLVLSLALFLTPIALAADSPAVEKAFPDLYKSGALFDRKQYKSVRAAFARAFQQKHAQTIRAAFGDSHAEFTSWLDSKPDIKEDLYTAINEEHDDVEAALKLFAALWKDHPTEIEPYAALAIATAVTWDRPDFDRTTGKRGGLYDYRHHQMRTRSSMPADLADAKANFDYIVNADASVTASVKPLPWEFLVFVVDHKTPVAERKWAQLYVKTRRGRVSSWHQDIAYDHGMLQTELSGKGPGPRLAGHPYTLANIKKFGGVCAQQADFVARVGKSMGQPSMYISGESSYRGWHAWVMWVAVVKSGKDRLRFNLVSDGRTRGFERDAFYVGHLTDPQTGQRMLDRDMERRLGTIALDLLGHRQASLAMRAYPIVVKAADLDVKARIAYLDRCLQVSPQSEQAWLEFAKMARDGELNDSFKGTAAARLATLTKTFARYPDFLARLSDDLLKPETNALAKVKHYLLATGIYEKAGRPDLACNTRLKIAQLQEEQKRYKEAAQTLTTGVRRFPTEGRYIPQLLNAYEKVCDHHPAGIKLLGNLYVELAPALILHYRGERNPFLDKVVAQGTNFFKTNNLERQGATFKTRIAQARIRAAAMKK